jgi:hypothetical protein
MIQWQTFPKSASTIPKIVEAVKVFESHLFAIDSKTHDAFTSNEVLGVIRPDLEALGFKVETDKSASGKIKIPVLFGLNGRPEKTFDADAFHAEQGIVMEVEAGRAVANYQFLKDLFQACMMQDAKYLVIAVRNTYRGNSDFESVKNFFETLYASSRLQLPLTSLTIIGY